ncbi:DUF7667 family protein [Geobacillus stearothermophilus]
MESSYRYARSIWIDRKNPPMSRRVYFSSKHPNLHQTILSMSREYGEIAKLKKLSLLAGMTGDVGWQHKLCARLKKLSR